MQTQRGFIWFPVLIAIVLGIMVLGGGTYFVMHNKSVPQNTTSQDSQTQSSQKSQDNTNTFSGMASSTSSGDCNDQIKNIPGLRYIEYPPNRSGLEYGFANPSGKYIPEMRKLHHAYIVNGNFFGFDNAGDEDRDFLGMRKLDHSRYAVKGDTVYYLYDLSYNSAVFDKFSCIPGASAKTFEVLDDNFYAKDDKNIYAYQMTYEYEDRVAIIKEADRNSFVALTDGFAKDKNRVYVTGFGYYEVLDLDPISFERLPGGDYLKDNRYVYHRFCYEGCSFGKTDADAQTFKVLDYQYTSDKNSVYYTFVDENGVRRQTIVSGADPATFHPVTGRGWDAEDKDNKYKEGKVYVEGQ